MKKLKENTVRKLRRIAFFGLAYAVLFKALYLLLIDTSFARGYGFLARVWLAFWEGVSTLPETVSVVIGFVGSVSFYLRVMLAGQLGYDPFVAPSLGHGRDYAVTLPAGVLELVWVPIFAVLIVSLFQLTFYCLLSILGSEIIWRKVGRPAFLSDRARIINVGVTYSFGVFVGYVSLTLGIVSGLIACACVFVILKRPVIAGFPLWLLEGFDLTPRQLLARILGPFSRGAPSSRQRPERDPADFGWEPDFEEDDLWDDEPQTSSSAPARFDYEGKLAKAHEVFELPPGRVVREDVVVRFRRLARKFHPDVHGSDASMAEVNESYEFLLQHYGWRR